VNGVRLPAGEQTFLIVAAVGRTKDAIFENLTMCVGYWTFRLQLPEEDKRFDEIDMKQLDMSCDVV